MAVVPHKPRSGSQHGGGHPCSKTPGEAHLLERSDGAALLGGVGVICGVLGGKEDDCVHLGAVNVRQHHLKRRRRVHTGSEGCIMSARHAGGLACQTIEPADLDQQSLCGSLGPGH